MYNSTSRFKMSSVISVTMMMNNMMSGMMRSVACQVIDGCASKYGFDGDEAKRSLDLHLAKKALVSGRKKEVKAKAAFPLPFNGEHSTNCCQALRQNNGLYTQCQASIKNSGTYCKSCQQLADKSSDGIPEYGTISMRLATNPYDYVDPKGRKPTSYTKVIKKYNLTQEQVNEEAAKFGISIDAAHFVVPEETKRGRPAKAPKEPKEAKAVKGRPKKSTKLIALADDEEDLFATLVAQANVVDEELEDTKTEEKEAKAQKLAEEKEAKAQKLAEEKEAKAQKLAEEKEAKIQKLAEEKEAKAQKLAEEKEAKAQKLAEEKEAKAQKLAEEKETKTQKLAEEKEAKTQKLAQAKEASKKAPKVSKKVEEPAEEEETYKKCSGPDGKKYIRSQQSNVVYDFEIYTAKEELVAVGKWVADSKSVVFNNDADSESELEDDEVDE